MAPVPDDDPPVSRLTGAPRDVWDLEWWSPDGDLAGLVVVDASADRNRTALLVALVGPDREPVVVVDFDLPLPAPTFELRSSGVWIELVGMVPLDHWTIGLEAFALAVGSDEVVGPDTFGHRVPVGLDLDVEAAGEATEAPGGFAVDCLVHGEVLVGAEEIALDGRGVRRRRCDGGLPSLRAAGDAPPVASLTHDWPGRSEPVQRQFVAGSGWVSV